MAKKNKRSYSRGETSTAAAPVRERVEPVVSSNSMAAGPKTTTGKIAPSQARTGTYSEFNPDYSYVVKDLKKIAIMGGSFVVILIVLSFFLK